MQGEHQLAAPDLLWRREGIRHMANVQAAIAMIGAPLAAADLRKPGTNVGDGYVIARVVDQIVAGIAAEHVGGTPDAMGGVAGGFDITAALVGVPRGECRGNRSDTGNVLVRDVELDLCGQFPGHVAAADWIGRQHWLRQHYRAWQRCAAAYLGGPKVRESSDHNLDRKFLARRGG